MQKKIFFTILTVSILSACSSGDDNKSQESSKIETPPLPINNTCAENGEYACKTGSTEPLYPFQWALNYKNSFFKAFKDIWKSDSDQQNYDLNVETVHQEGIKGQGINVIVIDDGIEVNHEDLASNINRNMTLNFDNFSNDPTPEDTPDNIDAAHGTNVAGIIAAAQNGKGVIGIAPKVNLGGALYIGASNVNELLAYGGGEFSQNADIFNASYGINPENPIPYSTPSTLPIALRALPNLRENKGALFIKAGGNEFIDFEESETYRRDCLDQFKGVLSCENPAHDVDALEPTVILVSAGNARGIKASYSNAGPVNWITGLGGEAARGGDFGEGSHAYTAILDKNGPSIFSTDLQGCKRGYSRSDIRRNLFSQGLSSFQGIRNNSNCNYSQMGGTSAATPTISGVTALVLQANPNLTWRDVREVLRQSARVIDSNYAARTGGNRVVDLATGQFLSRTGTTNDLQDGSTQVPLEFGWQTNAAGAKYSNWYGFGLADAHAAVKLAKTYKAGSLKAELQIPDFVNAFPQIEQLNYEKVTRLGTISINQSTVIDQFQLRVTGPLCVGSVGFFVKSPSGVVSPLSLPYNIFYKTAVSRANNYGLGSYAFHGEKSSGQWEIYAVSGNKGHCESNVSAENPLKVEYRIIPKLYS